MRDRGRYLNSQTSKGDHGLFFCFLLALFQSSLVCLFISICSYFTCHLSLLLFLQHCLNVSFVLCTIPYRRQVIIWHFYFPLLKPFYSFHMLYKGMYVCIQCTYLMTVLCNCLFFFLFSGLSRDLETVPHHGECQVTNAKLSVLHAKHDIYVKSPLKIHNSKYFGNCVEPQVKYMH